MDPYPAHFEAKIRIFKKNRELEASTKDLDDKKYVHPGLQVLYTQVTNQNLI